MNKSGLCLIAGLIPAMLALTPGCASKKYVKTQLAPVNSNVAALQATTNAQREKERRDISRVEEKLGSTDRRVAEVATTAQQANTRAAQANQTGQQNQAAIAANTASITALDNARNYSLVASGDVTFAFGRSDLTKTDKAALDTLAQQVQSTRGVVFELYGFTDPVGSTAYNLALSRRRAESVARYLVDQGIPLRGIHIIGLGEEPVPPGLLAEVQAVDPNAKAANSARLARRVRIQIYAPATTIESTSLQY